MLDEIGADRLELVDERLCLCGDMQPPRPPIVRIAGAFDESRLFEAVDNPAQGDRLEIEHIRQLDLPQAGRAGQLEQHLPLRARNPEPDRQPVERLAQRMRGLADFKGECFHGLNIVSVLILSNA